MNTEEYLQRIHYSGNREANLETLIQLQRAHLFHVPFENLDIHWGIPIEINLANIYRKVVLSHRGGFCYELNGLFYLLLKSLGFEVRRISARVYNAKKKAFGHEYDHLAVLVNLLGKQYLADVGYGEFAEAPLLVEKGIIQQDGRGKFKIEGYDDTYLLVSKEVEGTYVPEYIFTLQEREWKEYEAMCRFHQTSPESSFTQKRLITRATEKGRITLTGLTLKIREEGVTKEYKLKGEAEWKAKLKERFGISEFR